MFDLSAYDSRMGFVSILVALLLEQARPLKQGNAAHGLARAWVRWVGHSFDAGRPQHAVLAGNGREALAQVGQRGPRLTHLDARAGGDFKLALQHLALYLGRTLGTNGCNELRRYIADRWLFNRWLCQFI